MSHAQSRYVAKVRIYDTYNSNTGDETGDGIGSILNNVGYIAQDQNLGIEYFWEASFEYSTRWDWYGK